MQRSLTEFAVAALIALICVIILVQALKLPPGTFEPLGSGPVPIWTSVVVITCCFVVMIRAVIRIRATGGPRALFRQELEVDSPGKGLILVVATLLYVLALDLQLASFGIITFVYLTLLIWALADFGAKTLMFAAINAAIFAFGAEYLFTNVFVVDLPV